MLWGLEARSTIGAAWVVLVLCGGGAWAQGHPNTARGFGTGPTYQEGDLDVINVFNGTLNLTLPIGQTYSAGGQLGYGLVAFYSTNLWDVEEVDTSSGRKVQALPDRLANGGLGWLLSLGRLFPTTSPLNNVAGWSYQGPDGAVHTLHNTPDTSGSPDLDPGVFYSRDHTFLRFREAQMELEHADGTIRTFESCGVSCPDILRPVQIRDRFGNSLDITYFEADATNPKRWRLIDGTGRTHWVRFQPATNYLGFLVSEVDLAAFGNTRAVYTFTHETRTVFRPCWDDDDGFPWSTPETASVPVLTEIAGPHGAVYTMPDYLTGEGSCSEPANSNLFSGQLEGIDLPTGGRIEWDYRAYLFPQESGRLIAFRQSAGVGARRLLDNSGSVLGEWTYEPELQPPGVPGQADALRNTVTDPLGHRTEHHFAVKGIWEYGLPFTSAEDDGDTPPRFLSTRVIDKDGVLLRTSYLRYEHDPVTNPLLKASNRRVASSKVVHHSAGDVDRFREVTRSDYTGTGLYRRSETSGNFGAGDARTTFTDYAGLPASGEPWVLGLFTEQRVEEGPFQATVDFCFETSTGFLQRQRVRYLMSPGPQDVLSVFDRDTSGNLTRERYYGGDVQTVPSGNLCTLSLPTPNQYRIDHTYQLGVLATSEYKDAGGASMGFKHVDRTIDPSTGLVAASRDTTGLETAFEYDQLGRLTWVKPASGHDAWTEHAHTAGTTPAAPTRITTRQRGGSSKTGPVLAESEVRFDALGRVWRERQRMADGSWSTRETLYDGAGNRASVSELGTFSALSQKTQFLGYDPFGRPGTIRPPDGSAHDVTFTYEGVRQVSRTVNVATNRLPIGGVIVEKPVTTTELYDGRGRLWQVTEPSGEGGAEVTTTYAYDPRDRLATVETPAEGVTQRRAFNIDRRGFLAWEDHPEKGPSGNGRVSYFGYDARGHVNRRDDGPNDLVFVYDRAERLVRVRETAAPARVLKEFTYATANAGTDRRKGKLVEAVRHNDVPLPFNPTAIFCDGFESGDTSAWEGGSRTPCPGGFVASTVTVAETYAYEGRGGRLSSRDTTVSADDTPQHAFTQAWAWDELGNVDTLTYPTCVLGGCTGATGPRTQTFAYTNGFLTAVPGYTGTVAGAPAGTGLTYHPNGMLAAVTHANGVTWTQGADPNQMLRPSSISTAGANDNWSSGTYAYDGAGNVTTIGTSWFLYDDVSRLKTATQFPGTTGGGAQHQRTYAYDAFGNLKEIAGTGGRTIPVAAASNRLFGAGTSYDAAGNLTAWNGATFQYDLLDRLAHHENANEEHDYLYTPDDERIATYDVLRGSWRWVLRNLDGQALRELRNDTGAWRLERDYIYRGAILLAAEGPAGLRHFHPDHLGSPRLVTDSAGTHTAYHVYFPYGEELTASGQDAERLKFTGHERDLYDPAGAGDDLDYMHARFYNPWVGRFLGFDPVGGVPRNPQSWNRYSYVTGNPLKYIDPFGLRGETPDDPFRDSICVTSTGDPCSDFDFSRFTRFFAFGDFTLGRGVYSTGPQDFGLFDVARAKRFYQSNFERFAAGPEENLLLAALFFSIDEVFVPDSQAELGVELAMAAIPGPLDNAALGVLKGVKKLSKQGQKSVRSLLKQIERHQKKLAQFRANPTVRPGMEGLPEAMIRQQQARRIQHLESEIAAFEESIRRVLRGEPP